VRILFIDINQDENVGSYRIWVRDLARTLEEIGHKVSVLNGSENLSDYSKEVPDAIILGKSTFRSAPGVKSLFGKSKVGTINIASDHVDPSIDFVIVGSPEEYVSMSEYKNVFIYPLIERKFENVVEKDHKKENTIRFCFHGHYPHISKFFPYVSQALEAYHNQVNPCELHVITGESADPYGGKFFPPSVPVSFYNYKKIDFTEVVKSCDIGLVPNITPVENIAPDITSYENNGVGLYNTDFNIRFKNKTNGGRAYVFYQHGIPVIHDLSPSSFDFMGRTGVYCCAHDAKSYLREMIRLSDHNFRNKVSKINSATFKRDFNPVKHAEDLIEFIKEV
jgi:hypothetical protein